MAKLRPVQLSRELELDQWISLKQAAQMRGDMSEKTLRKVLADKIKQLAPNRVGITIRDALAPID